MLLALRLYVILPQCIAGVKLAAQCGKQRLVFFHPDAGFVLTVGGMGSILCYVWSAGVRRLSRKPAALAYIRVAGFLCVLEMY